MSLRSDAELLAQYVRADSREAFTELVERHRDWVYSAALRRVRDAHLADDVTQAVFIVLARRAGSIGKGAVLSAWLFGVMRYAALGALRSESRRRRHEMIAADMRRSETMTDATSEIDDRLSTELDLAVEKLGKKDRTAVLLRFYERKSLAEVGAAMEISEEAARKRVDRAVEKLRVRLAGKDATLSSVPGAVLLSWLEHHIVHTAPMQAATLASAALSAARSNLAGPGASLAKGAIRMLIWNKVKLIAVACLLAICCIVMMTPLAIRRIPFVHADEPAQGAGQAGADQTAGGEEEMHYSPTLMLTVGDIAKSVDFYKRLGFVTDNAPGVDSSGSQIKGGVVRIRFVEGVTTDADRAARQKFQVRLEASVPGGTDRLQVCRDLQGKLAAAGIKTGDLIEGNEFPEFSVVDPDGYVLVVEFR
jgi:RNA polymerase sigma factor (sigma-70 family)